MKRLLILSGALALAGCGGRIEPQGSTCVSRCQCKGRAECLKLRYRPGQPPACARPTVWEVKLPALLAERRQRVGCQNQLQAAVSACN